jgi:ABC-type glycerol-3-phosphate transport system substrate-binding protein
MNRFIKHGLAALALTLTSGTALSVDGTLTIVTSYPTDTTNTFKAAFEKKYPGVKVEMLKKKTTAGIKYLQEISASNTADMFWASAPDAFEVLKGDDLLVKYDVKVTGIPKNVGSFPINDPDGYYMVGSERPDLAWPRGHECTFTFRHHAPDGRNLDSGHGLGCWLG